MGKNSSKNIVDIGEKVLAKISRGRQSQRKQALQTRWKEAVWVGIAKMSNEHIAVLEDGGHAVGCRTVKRRPKDATCNGNTILGIVATPRKPNPSEPDKKEIGTGVTMKFQEPEPLTKPEVCSEEEVVRRNFRITKRILEKDGHTPGCIGCSAALAGGGRGRREHADAWRNRIENKILQDPDEKVWIEKRDKRRPPGKATCSTLAAPEVLHATGRDQKKEEIHDHELMNEVGGPADAGDGEPKLSPEDIEVGVEADEEHDVLYEAGESETIRLKSSVPEGNLEHEPKATRRKLANVHGSKARVTQVLRLQKYDRSLQKMTKMLLDLEFGKTRETDRKDVCTPHDDDEKWADMFGDSVIADDVNGGKELDKNLVIEARKTEMEFFKKWQCTARFRSPLSRKREARSSRRVGWTRTRATKRERELSLEACHQGNVTARIHTCCQDGASHVCDTVSFLREQRMVCPDPPAMTHKLAVEPHRARLREILAAVTVSPHFPPCCLSVVIQ